MMIASPMLGCTLVVGAARTPASAASATPKPNVTVTSRRVSMPNARTSTGFSVAARIRAPTGVRSTTYHVSAHSATATTITNSLYVGYTVNPMFVTPDSTSGVVYGEPSGPAMYRMRSSSTSTIANVSSRL